MPRHKLYHLYRALFLSLLFVDKMNSQQKVDYFKEPQSCNKFKTKLMTLSVIEKLQILYYLCVSKNEIILDKVKVKPTERKFSDSKKIKNIFIYFISLNLQISLLFNS